MKKSRKNRADARSWMVRIVAGVCALLIIGSVFAGLL